MDILEESDGTCDRCRRPFRYPRRIAGVDKELPEPDLCPDCEFAKGMASVEPPEGGWPRGSDMDRI